MLKAIKTFNQQFGYKPTVEFSEKLKRREFFVVLGMGGSHLAAGLYKLWRPKAKLMIHKNYGLPNLEDKELKSSLIIASSYSGNTEEVIDGLSQALKQGLDCAVVAVGGKLIDIAKRHNLPYVQIPATGIQPRSALGLSLIALAALLGDGQLLDELANLGGKLNPLAYQQAGKDLAQELKNKTPIVYSSTVNLPIAYNWKIKFNETGKIPAFYNVFPEMNHNEMTGFDTVDASRGLSSNFYCLFLRDSADHERIKKRMDVVGKLYQNRGLPVKSVPIAGDSLGEKVFSNLILADWTAYYTALNYGAEPTEVPMVEELKKMIA